MGVLFGDTPVKSLLPALSPQVRIMFEVQDLKYATLATVSRCGMVWFSEDVLSTDMIFNHFLARLRSIPLDEGEDEAGRIRKGTEDEEETASPMLQVGVHHSPSRFRITLLMDRKRK